MRIIFGIIITFLLIPIFPDQCQSQLHGELFRNSLKGLEPVLVQFSAQKGEFEDLGLKSETFQTEMEYTLRKAGIKVVSASDHASMPDVPMVGTYIELLKISEINSYVFITKMHVGLNLINPKTKEQYYAYIWERDQYGIFSENNKKMVKEGMKKLINAFINDYLAVNPK